MGVSSPPPPSPPQNTSKNDYVIPQLDGNYSDYTSSSSSNYSPDQSQLSSVSMSSSNCISEDNTMEKSWFSQISDCGSAQPNLVNCENVIPVITGYRPHRDIPYRLPAACRVIRRENKCVQALSLPILLPTT